MHLDSQIMANLICHHQRLLVNHASSMTGHIYILNRGRKSAVLYFYDLNTSHVPKIYRLPGLWLFWTSDDLF